MGIFACRFQRSQDNHMVNTSFVSMGKESDGISRHKLLAPRRAGPEPESALPSGMPDKLVVKGPCKLLSFV